MALVLKSALLIFNHKNPQLRYALSALAMLASLLLPLITFSIIYRAEIALSSTSTVALTLTELMQELKQPDGLFSYQELSALLPSLLPYIALLWLATVTLLAGKLLVEIYNVNKLPQQHSVEPSAQLSARFNELAKQINLTI
ncbi:MAG: M56 family peptidase, partial [Colwellia sp.]|nr:M56 family peptidase [Colwellia sp.]